MHFDEKNVLRTLAGIIVAAVLFLALNVWSVLRQSEEDRCRKESLFPVYASAFSVTAEYCSKDGR